jgi:arylformamidase
VLFSYNADLKLDDAEAARLSPVRLRTQSKGPVLIAVGADETSEFLRQSTLLWDAWPENRVPGATGPLVIPERNHFEVVADFGDPAGGLSRQTLSLF